MIYLAGSLFLAPRAVETGNEESNNHLAKTKDLLLVVVNICQMAVTMTSATFPREMW